MGRERGGKIAARCIDGGRGEREGKSDLSKSVPDARKGFDAPINLRFT